MDRFNRKKLIRKCQKQIRNINKVIKTSRVQKNTQCLTKNKQNRPESKWIYCLLLSIKIVESFHHTIGFLMAFVDKLNANMQSYLMLVSVQIRLLYTKCIIIWQPILPVGAFVVTWTLEFKDFKIKINNISKMLIASLRF